MDLNQTNSAFQVSLDVPYPPVKAQSQRLDYAHAMLSNVGSRNSEMSAVSLYFYNSVVLKSEYAGFARCFHEISVVEMHHLDIFSTLAMQMGLDPRLWSFNRTRPFYWTPSYNHYSRKLKQLVENALQGEEEAIDKYKRQCDTIKDENIVENLKRIILDEEHHMEIFRSMLAHLK